MAKNVLKNPGKALEIGANVGTAFAPRSPKAASSLPDVTSFYQTGEGLCHGKFVNIVNFIFSVPINVDTYIDVIPICTIRK